MKRETCGSCLKHPPEEELQSHAADGCEAQLSETNLVPPNKQEKPGFLVLGSAEKTRSVVAVVPLRTLRTRCLPSARAEIFQPGGQRSAVCGCQLSGEVDQSPQGKIFLFMEEKMW